MKIIIYLYKELLKVLMNYCMNDYAIIMLYFIISYVFVKPKFNLSSNGLSLSKIDDPFVHYSLYHLADCVKVALYKPMGNDHPYQLEFD